MTTLLLRLSGPLQAWGVSSKYARRDTAREPTKSGIIGMLAAARGIRRTDPLPDDLLGLRFGVRADCPGTVMSDFQTARRSDGSSLPLSYRNYLADAVFLVVLEGDHELLAGLKESLVRPGFPLYLGRRSCPPGQPVVGTLDPRGLATVLEQHEWIAPRWYARRHDESIALDVSRDLLPDEETEMSNVRETGDLVRDVPISFAPEHRQHGWRVVKRYRVRVPNSAAEPRNGPPSLPPHEPAAFGD